MSDHATGTAHSLCGRRKVNETHVIKVNKHILPIPITTLLAVKRAEEHLLLVTHERSVYRQMLDESRWQA
jgi:hypothetical protein